MRDYKDHSSRQPRPEAPVRVPSHPLPAKPEEPVEEEEVTPRRGGSAWIWLVLIALLLLSGAVWWWIASLPMTKGQLGLFPQQAGKPAQTSVVVSAASKPPAAPVVAAVQSPPKAAVLPSAVAPVAAPLASAVSPSASTSSTVQFNFYHILPQMKVDIPSDILGSGPGIPAAATSSAAAGGPVRIQVGALNNRAGAEVIRERLELMGIASHLQELSGPDGASYYLVLTRSYASASEAQAALTKIRGMGVTPVLRPAAPTLSAAPSASPAP